MIWETKRHESEINNLSQRIKELQNELQRTYTEKGTNTNKVNELDQLIAQLLTVNESLVTQLSGKMKNHSIPMNNTSNIPIKVKKIKSKKPTMIPRVASVTTAALEAGRILRKSSTERLIPVKSDEVEQLQKLHNMYANIAQTILEKKPTKKRLSANEVLINSVLTSDKKNGGRTRTPTRISRKKVSNKFNESIIGSDLRENQTQNITSHYHNNSNDDSFHTYGNTNSHSNPHSNVTMRSSSTNSRFQKNHSNQINNDTTINNNDLQDVIGSLEEEFEYLNSQYRRLLSSQSTNNNNNSDSTRAEALISVIQQLHKKGEQLRSLKSPVKS